MTAVSVVEADGAVESAGSATVVTVVEVLDSLRVGREVQAVTVMHRTNARNRADILRRVMLILLCDAPQGKRRLAIIR